MQNKLVIDIISLSFSLFLFQLYNEEIIDLFDPDRDQVLGVTMLREVHIYVLLCFCLQPKKLRVHEDAVGNIYVAGATDIKVESENEVDMYMYMCHLVVVVYAPLVMAGWNYSHPSSIHASLNSIN